MLITLNFTSRLKEVVLSVVDISHVVILQITDNKSHCGLQ